MSSRYNSPDDLGHAQQFGSLESRVRKLEAQAGVTTASNKKTNAFKPTSLTSFTSASYVALGLEKEILKKFSSTKLHVDVKGSCWSTAAGNSITIGASVDSGTTIEDVVRFLINPVSTHLGWGGDLELIALPGAGSVVVALYIKVGASQINFDQNDQVTVTVTEVTAA